jgi:hypothetical protein
MRNKKLFSLVIAIAFLFSAMGLVAFAPSSASAAVSYLDGTAIPPDPSDPDCSTVLVDNTIEVTFIIEAGDALDPDGYVDVPNTRFRKELSVAVSADFGKAITVTTLLDKVDGTNGLTFYGKSGNNLVPFDDSTDYLAAVEVSGASPYPATWEAGVLGYDGWVFRVNDKYLVKVTDDGQGYEGLSILQTALADGDTVHFFYDFPSTLFGDDYTANYVRGVFEDLTGNTLTVQLQGHTTNIHGNPPIMDVNDYADLAVSGISASLYQADGVTPVGGTATSGATGEVTFAGVASGTYVLKTVPTYHVYGGDLDDAFFNLTGAYSEIIVP